ncbi:hypothetical protein [Microcoleus vaginatus]|uniref:hypothetical protein n=1 Tax=Microcoleus vaginatus TaxID=119532 RepID=UPI00020D1EF6|nr:hypothetical protein MicvaDRAFT_3931 [Microcoleus vaginatus FGP-2]
MSIIAPVIGWLLVAIGGILGGIEVGGVAGGTAAISIEIVFFAITINMNTRK